MNNRKGLFGLPTLREILFTGEGGQTFHQEEDPWGAFRFFPGTKVDYKKKVGDPGNQSLVMAAVNWLGTQLIEAPLCVYEKDSEGQVQKVEKHPLEKLMQHPTPYFSGGLLYKAFAMPWIIDGNVYWFKVRDRSGEIVEIWPLRSSAVQPAYRDDGASYIDGYIYRVESKDYWLRQDDVVHFRYGLDPLNPRKGLSPLASLYRELFADNERANFQGAMLANFGVAGSVISPKSDTVIIGEKGRQQLKKEFHAQHTGDMRGDVMVASQNIQVSPLGFEPDKLALNVLAQLPEERVSAVLMIPSAVLGFGAGLRYTNYATMKELREQAYEGAVIPTQKLIAQEIDAQLLYEFDGKETKRRSEFDLTEVRVLQEDETKLTDRLEKSWKSGLITRGEARKALDFPVDEKRDAVFQASAGTALIPEDMADGQSLQPVVSTFDQQQARAGGAKPGEAGAQGQTYPPKQGQGKPATDKVM